MTMLQAQAIKQFHPDDIPDLGTLQGLLEQGNILIVKNVFDKELVRKTRRDLALWRQNARALDEAQISKERILNGFLPLSHQSTRMTNDLDFRSDKTGINAWNYRFGNLHDENLIPSIQKNGEIFLQAFERYCPVDPLPHATETGKNLYVEFMHFPVSSGYVEEHTHESIAEFGLEFNMIGVFSDRGKDYEQGGPVFPGPHGEFRIDDFTESGDVYLFSNRMVHRVDAIQSNIPESDGRWILTYFWY